MRHDVITLREAAFRVAHELYERLLAFQQPPLGRPGRYLIDQIQDIGGTVLALVAGVGDDIRGDHTQRLQALCQLREARREAVHLVTLLDYAGSRGVAAAVHAEPALRRAEQLAALLAATAIEVRYVGVRLAF